VCTMLTVVGLFIHPHRHNDAQTPGLSASAALPAAVLPEEAEGE